MTPRAGLFAQHDGATIPAAYAIAAPPAMAKTYAQLDVRVDLGVWFKVLKRTPPAHGSSGSPYGSWPIHGGDARITVERLAVACGYRWNY